MSETPTCRTCAFWQIDPDHNDAWRLDSLAVRDDDLEPVDPQPFEIRRCHSPKLREYERPEQDGAATLDGSEYYSALFTGPDFGCIHHHTVTPP